MHLVYLSPVPWTSFAQRPHKFVEWFHSRFGGTVLWIDPYPTRFPELSDFRRVNATKSSANVQAIGWQTPSWLAVVRPRSLPIEPMPGSGVLNRLLWSSTLGAVDLFLDKENSRLAIGKPSELALQVMNRHPAVPSLYDAMDDFPAFYGGLSRKAMERRERKVASRVTRISVSSSALLDRFSIHREKLSCVPNACSVEFLPPSRDAAKSSGRIVIGYIGTMGHWFDWGLVKVLATTNPSKIIRLIGPIHKSPPKPMPPNVELLPACSHAIAMRMMQDFSIGLIPFMRTDLTASVDPIKYYEYRALGLPVISTQFGEMALRRGEPGVFLTDGKSDLSAAVSSAMAYQSDTDEVEEFRLANSWGVRFDSGRILA